MPWMSEWEAYAPTFSEEDEWNAQQEGYQSALEKWCADIETKQFIHFHDSVRKRAKAQMQSDLHSIGRPYDRLGALAKAANAMPAPPEYVDPEPQPVRNPVTRAAQIHGMTRYAERLMRTAERYGVPWRNALSEDGGYHPEVRHLYAEWQNLRQRLSVLGEDLDAIADGIADGTVKVTEDFDVAIPPEDPELRRAHEARDADMKRQREANGPAEEEEEHEEEVEADSWLTEWEGEPEAEADHSDCAWRSSSPNGGRDSDDNEWARSEPDEWDDDDVSEEEDEGDA